MWKPTSKRHQLNCECPLRPKIRMIPPSACFTRLISCQIVGTRAKPCIALYSTEKPCFVCTPIEFTGAMANGRIQPYIGCFSIQVFSSRMWNHHYLGPIFKSGRVGIAYSFVLSLSAFVRRTTVVTGMNSATRVSTGREPLGAPNSNS